jgi:hypothetical protein
MTCLGRVRVSGTKGLPPPPTTKVAMFYNAGYQCEYVVGLTFDSGYMETYQQARYTLNATGYATAEKFKLHEAQIRFRLDEEKQLENFHTLVFQVQVAVQ